MEHPKSLADSLFSCGYFAVLFAIGVTYFIVFYRGKDAAMKRKWWPRLIIAVGIVMAAYLAADILQMPPSKAGHDEHLEIPATLMLVFIAAFVFLQIKTTQFCDKCAAIVHRRLFKSVNFCPTCGAELLKPR